LNSQSTLETRALTHGIVSSLEGIPGQSVKELATRLSVNRQFLSGYLTALEDLRVVSSRTVGTARIYFRVRPESLISVESM